MTDETGLNRFLARSAHDIKQPLNVLQMYLGILQRRSAGDDKGSELNGVVSNAMKSVQSTLNLLTQWARAEEQSLKQRPASHSLAQLHDMSKQLKRITVPDADSPISTAAECSIDLQLLQQTLQDIIHLLPQPTRITLSDSNWELTLSAPLLVKTDDSGTETYNDALFELGIRAGRAILQQMGGTLSCTHSTVEEQSRLLLSFIP